MAEVEGAIVCGGPATDKDRQEIRRFREYLEVTAQGESAGLSRARARYYAANEVYGDPFCEGDGPKE